MSAFGKWTMDSWLSIWVTVSGDEEWDFPRRRWRISVSTTPEWESGPVILDGRTGGVSPLAGANRSWSWNPRHGNSWRFLLVYILSWYLLWRYARRWAGSWMWIVKYKLTVVSSYLSCLYATLHAFFKVLLNIIPWTEGFRESRVLSLR